MAVIIIDLNTGETVEEPTKPKETEAIRKARERERMEQMEYWRKRQPRLQIVPNV